MVTAIVIPILILYFYWVTKKEKAKQRQNWEMLDQVRLEARIYGTITYLHTEKKRYYHELYMMVTTIRMQSGDRTITAVYRQPFKQGWKEFNLHPGSIVTLEGQWEKDTFIAGIIKKS
ncbi:hypothetical protein JOC95_003628 [Bacillus tianshenii]|uniref:DUF3592 domain-containing protein n=1 Tax=Sutcliffiella tianshenii TaxID=1463404 RepID=A0ABS2P471_9BACI|nr:hypothetical protein [Bacillus tianshenii]MBM7621720.1 hypothetical protein [Bacillus tianshenii]